MTDITKDSARPRPVYRNVNFFSDLPTYRLPAAGIVSILHRISGLLMFLLLPFVIWMFDTSVSSEISFDAFRSAFVAGIGFVPGWFVKLVTLGLIWGYLHHFIAGVRHLWMDATHSVSKAQGHSSAVATLALSVLLTLALGAKLFGLY
ncbi:succinate dehydrogenase, cytochrome b556 subunit [Pelomonas sp. CA6]|uniref:succinate dehydrogenase, cytochrome b556 subunit n=1 Tax=Pelomonas sp. CA6 TaxID=2907999 RepID=UPI001F4C48AE|nr:succinate dehydrogenase, cytochrome b556 subunit [Pelomonas sp. CA6]MCH7345891.1 succinate dehydrogenase, cytochrome b556 subunit [Pelomonas sp. CA6]